MSDERLRWLERRWRETEGVEDEAAYLLERVRVGNLAQEQLELAAYCGQRAARSICSSVEIPDELEVWTRELARWTAEAAKRAAVGIAAQAASRWQEASLDDSRPREAARLAQHYLEQQHDNNLRRAVLEAGSASYDAARDMRMGAGVGEETWLWAAGEVAARAAWLLASDRDDDDETGPSSPPTEAQQAAEELEVIVGDATLFLTESEVRAAMQSALVAWALRGSVSGRA